MFSTSTLLIIGSLLLIMLLWHLLEFAWDNGHFKAYGDGGFAKNIHTLQALRVHKHLPELTAIDVRPLEKYQKRHIPGALNAPFEDGILDTSNFSHLDRSKPILLYCEGGYRSRRALPAILEEGFTAVYHINRGIKMWRFFGGVCRKDSSPATDESC